MLQVWKIEVPSSSVDGSTVFGWALARTAEEAKALCGQDNAMIQQMPEHLWIAKEHVIWERPIVI